MSETSSWVRMTTRETPRAKFTPCRTPPVATCWVQGLAGRYLHPSLSPWSQGAEHPVGPNASSGGFLYRGRSRPRQQLGPSPAGRPRGHDGAQAARQHRVASEKTGSVACGEPRKSSFSTMWFGVLFLGSNESTGRCSSGNPEHQQKFCRWIPGMIKIKVSLEAYV